MDKLSIDTSFVSPPSLKSLDNVLRCHRGLWQLMFPTYISLQNDELLDACESGDVITAASLLNSGADIEALDTVCFNITAFVFFCRPMHIHP